MSIQRRFPVGAEVLADGVDFRVWAPARRSVEVISGQTETPIASLRNEGTGYFSSRHPGLGAGFRYKLRLDGDPASTYPDPASRFQPDGPHGYSETVSPAFEWGDQNWPGVSIKNQILYEMHIGTFTPEGTWAAAARQLPELAAAGISVIEVMPVADFCGRHGWGYDGVNFFAPSRLYGTPRDFRCFVDAAHANGLGVLLDVVYNHAGPDGNFLSQFSPAYFTARYATDWGTAINFDGEDSLPVREYFLSNAAYWIEEFHLDGLRVDATQNIYDEGTPHILRELNGVVRDAAGGRKVIVIAENEPQDPRLATPVDQGGYGFDGMWNDDFHHSAMVALTGRSEAYYTDYAGTPQEFISAAKYGFLYQGQHYSWQKQSRGGCALDLPPRVFVNFLQNHDQVANSAHGLRVDRMTSPGRLRAMTALFLLMPGTPMLFQGQEFGSSNPFLFFSDHGPEIAKLARAGRAEFLSQFVSIGCATSPSVLADPGDPATFGKCKLDFSERVTNAPVYALHKDLIHLRKDDPVFRDGRVRVDGAVLGPRTFLLRFFGAGGDDRLLLVNLDIDFQPRIVPEPLLAPPIGSKWETLLSTEHPRYNGAGVYSLESEGKWRIPSESATVLSPLSAPVDVL